MTTHVGRVGVLGRAASDEAGRPTLTAAEAVALLREHIDLETMRTTDYDRELWELWQQEVWRGSGADPNADVLDRVLARLRVGE